MPGLSLIYKKKLDQALVSESLAELKHERNYKIQKFIENDNFILSFSGYEGYPKQYFEDDDYLILIEGLIYNKSDSEIATSLKIISKSYIENNNGKSAIKEFVDSADGEFNVLIYYKLLDRMVIFNDRWGRLHSYWYHDDDMFIFSREPSFILKFIPSIQFDKVSMVEFLVFEYPLSDRTLIKNVHMVNPSCKFDLEQSDDMLKVDVEKLFDVNFEESPVTLSKNECIERCKDLFLQSIDYRINKTREKNYKIIADLSGGFDTRAVFGGLCKLNVDADYWTRKRDAGQERGQVRHPVLTDESKYVDKVAALFSKKTTKITNSHIFSYSDMSRITYLTGCAVNGWTATATYRQSLELIKQFKDMSVRFMGFGGEFIRHPYKTTRYEKTMADMVKNGYFARHIKINPACSIIKLDEETFYNDLTAYFNRYPETTLEGKVKHAYFEYYHNSGVDEERHRLHFWTVQPLFSKDLFNFEMKHIPLKYIDNDFFIGFLRAINPILLHAPINHYNVKMNSKMSLYKLSLITKLQNIKPIKRIGKFMLKLISLKSQVNNKDICKGIRQELFKHYRELNILSPCLDEKSMRKYIENEDRALNLYVLITLILYFIEIEKRYGAKINHEVCA